MVATKVRKSESEPIVDVTQELGVTGLDISGGQIREEFLTELSGSRGMKVYREMAHNSATVGAILFAIRNLIRQVEWTVSPASASAVDEHAAEFLRSCQSDMAHTWGEFIDEVMSMLTYGFAIAEPVYKRRQGDATYDENGNVLTPESQYDDGAIGWRKLAPRAQSTVWEWNVDRSSDVLGFVQVGPPNYERLYIPASRFLLFRPTGYKSNPEGMSILRNAYRAWYFCKNLENIEGIGIERNLVGIPVVKVPPQFFSATATSDQRSMLAQFKQLVKNVHVNEQTGVVLPASYDDKGNPLYTLELLQSGGARPIDTGAVIQRWDQRIAQTVLADFILLGHQGVGSYALSDNKTTMFVTAIGTWLAAICEVLNRHAIPRLLKLNPQIKIDKGFPMFAYSDIETPDLAALGSYVTALSGAGFPLFPTPTGELEEYLLRAANLPVPPSGMVEIDDDDEVAPESSEAGEDGDAQETEMPEGKPATTQPAQPGTAPAPQGATDVASTAMNGAQITAVVDMIARVNAGEISREAAIELLFTAFPVTREQAVAIVGTAPPKVDRPDTTQPPPVASNVTPEETPGA